MQNKLLNQVRIDQLNILKQKQKFHLQYQYEKILGFCPMLNKTCVILAIKSHCLQCVAHIDQNGKILKQIVFRESNFYDFIITSDHEIVWLDIDRNLILQWNVQNYTLLQFPFQFQDDNVCPTHQLFLFPQTQMFCIAQWGPINSNIFKITYFCYPLLPESKPIHCFQSQEVWTYQHRVSRANMSSKLLWFIGKKFEEFRTYEVEKVQQDKYVGKYTQHKLNIDIIKAKIVVVNAIWEISPKKYLLITIADQSGLKPEQKINPFLVYEETEQNTNKVRQANFKISAQSYYKIVDCHCYGDITMIRTFNFKESKVEESAIYYINNNREQICARDSWKCTNLNKYVFPAHNSNLLIDAQYRNGDVKQIQCSSVLITSPYCLTAHMLISIIDDPCEDLLADVLVLLYGFY